MPEPGPFGETFLEAKLLAIVLALLVNNPGGGWVESVFTFATHRFFLTVITNLKILASRRNRTGMVSLNLLRAGRMTAITCNFGFVCAGIPAQFAAVPLPRQRDNLTPARWMCALVHNAASHGDDPFCGAPWAHYLFSPSRWNWMQRTITLISRQYRRRSIRCESRWISLSGRNYQQSERSPRIRMASPV
jgi:hypothetical protein